MTDEEKIRFVEVLMALDGVKFNPLRVYRGRRDYVGYLRRQLFLHWEHAGSRAYDAATEDLFQLLEDVHD